jgi:hypothetical protein
VSIFNKIIDFSEKVKFFFDFDFNILTALKGWVGPAAERRGALHIIYYFIFLTLRVRVASIIIISGLVPFIISGGGERDCLFHHYLVNQRPALAEVERS